MAAAKKPIWRNQPGDPIYRASRADVLQIKEMVREVLVAYRKFDDAMAKFSTICPTITVPKKYVLAKRNYGR